ncbi:site-specific DNA-methyltransferase [Moraxella ovis]|uniref:site-specific DNA-methyltransferase n=1 Tax=Moraxella ovis TaxID=29433 RepID=UPI000D961D4D|nr:site-specific DNA-methyltransferase [Moraxella ovis]SPX85714.1 putative methyltransferase [Moraxella ovis]STZ05485.1 putative methyltransferase [Moraxella ovis]
MDFDTTQNIFIESDNLEALKILQKSYAGKIKMIYIDPPYNTGNDFIYHDDFRQSKKEYDIATGDRDINGQLLKSFKKNSKDNGHYHSNWLNMMLPRLHLAHTLLSDDGVIFISIDDNEQAQLKLLCDEIFGEENLITQIAWRRTDNQPNIGNIAKVKEYLYCYAKNYDNLTLGKLSLSEKALKEYRYSDDTGLFRRKILLDKTRGRHHYEVRTISGNILTGPWMIKEEEFKKLDEQGLIYWTMGGDEQPYGKLYLTDSKGQIPNDFWGIEYGTNQRASLEVENLFNARYFDFPKPVSLIQNLLNIGTNKNSTILDFFAGSATTAHAVMQLNAEDDGNRQFIMVQLPELTDEKSEAHKAGFKTISDISKERIRRAGVKIKEKNPNKKLDTGFKVFKLSQSNFKAWQIDDDDISKQLEMYIDPLKDNVNEIDIIYELLLKMGLKLMADIKFDNGVYWLTCENKSYAVVLNLLSQDDFNAIIAKKPAKTVVLDKVFLNDSEKSNVILQFKDAGLNFESI